MSDEVSLTQFAQELESLGILVAERLIDLDLDKTLGSLVTTAGFDRHKHQGAQG